MRRVIFTGTYSICTGDFESETGFYKMLLCCRSGSMSQSNKLGCVFLNPKTSPSLGDRPLDYSHDPANKFLISRNEGFFHASRRWNNDAIFAGGWAMMACRKARIPQIRMRNSAPPDSLGVKVALDCQILLDRTSNASSSFRRTKRVCRSSDLSLGNSSRMSVTQENPEIDLEPVSEAFLCNEPPEE